MVEGTSVGSSIPSKVDAQYTRLFPVFGGSVLGFEVQAGGKVMGTTIVRVNSALQNNSVGLDIFANLMASAQASTDISRTKSIHRKFWFVRYTLQPQKRDMSMALHVGMANMAYRPGFAYIGQTALLNESKAFDGYMFSPFTGMRLGFDFNYTKYSKNGNGTRFTYRWEGLSSTGKSDRFELGVHSLSSTFLIHK